MTRTNTRLTSFFIGLITLMGLVFTFPASVGAQWYQQDTQTLLPLYDVHAWSTTQAVAVGQDGLIRYTEDGGTSWDTAPSGTSKHLYAVEASTASILYAVGFNGTITRSTTAGTSWSTLPSGTSADLWGVAFVDKKTGVAVGESGKILQTTDGVSFTSRTSGTPNDLFDAYAADDSTIYAVGANGSIVKSVNDGTHWLAQTSGTTEHLYAVWCSSATHCVATGENSTVLETTDGSSWSAHSLDLGSYAGLSVDGYDENHFAVGAGDDAVYLTNNGGTSFTAIDLDEASPFYHSLSYFDANTLFTAGDDVSGNGVIWRHDGSAPSTPGNVTVLEGNPSDTDTVTLSWDASTDSESGVLYYAVTVVDEKLYTTNDTELELDSMPDGTYSVLVSAVDGAANESETVALTLTIDTVDPTVGNVTPVEAYTAETTTLRVSTSDATSGVASCELAINGFTVGTMTHAGGGTYEIDYGFTVPGAYTAFAACLDAAGNATAGAVTNITVALGPNPDPAPEPEAEAEMSSLITTTCPGGEDASHPCRAVYWYGTDGMRHAFPNDKAYFTWFSNFDDVIEVTDAFMASLTLGPNVTYKPGSKMVKFPSVDTVYAVGEMGELRGIDSEAVATDLYGAAWNTLIDDINIAFFFNYDYGTDVLSAGDYDQVAAQAAMSSPDDLF